MEDPPAIEAAGVTPAILVKKLQSSPRLRASLGSGVLMLFADRLSDLPPWGSTRLVDCKNDAI